MINLKQKIYDSCINMIHDRITNAELALKSSQESMANETKSSAGDKFETSRAMLQAQQDRMKSVIIKNRQLENNLLQTNLTHQEIIRTGALVHTDQLNYFISVGLGKIIIDGGIYYAISAVSPIGKLLIGKQKGDIFSFNGKTGKVLDVE